jgi:hypothetical protein
VHHRHACTALAITRLADRRHIVGQFEIIRCNTHRTGRSSQQRSNWSMGEPEPLVGPWLRPGVSVRRRVRVRSEMFVASQPCNEVRVSGVNDAPDAIGNQIEANSQEHDDCDRWACVHHAILRLSRCSRATPGRRAKYRNVNPTVAVETTRKRRGRLQRHPRQRGHESRLLQPLR